jgi:hypothetical protein
VFIYSREEILNEVLTLFFRIGRQHARVPRGDYDCAWDYLAAKCKYPEFCEYRYLSITLLAQLGTTTRLTPLMLLFSVTCLATSRWTNRAD